MAWRFMWIVCLLSFAVFLKFGGLEGIEKSGIIKNISLSSFSETKSKWKIYENWELEAKVSLSGEGTKYRAVNWIYKNCPNLSTPGKCGCGHLEVNKSSYEVRTQLTVYVK